MIDLRKMASDSGAWWSQMNGAWVFDDEAIHRFARALLDAAKTECDKRALWSDRPYTPIDCAEAISKLLPEEQQP